MTFFAQMIKEAVVGVINAKVLTDIRYGVVVSVSPLKVQIDQKLTLNKAQLKLTRAVLDCDVEMSVNGGDKQIYTIYNSLKINDKVMMVRVQGGQQYIVIDKEVVE